MNMIQNNLRLLLLILYIQSVPADAMARSKRDEVLKQRISEATGMPIGDINAQNSRCFKDFR